MFLDARIMSYKNKIPGPIHLPQAYVKKFKEFAEKERERERERERKRECDEQ